VGRLAPARIPEAAHTAPAAAAVTGPARPDVETQLVAAGLDPEPSAGAGPPRTIEADIKRRAR
jgi:hypothetical protein